LQKHLDKLTNQARFIQMIIDGKLVVSRKKKAVLISELKKLNFVPFPKVDDAKKAGEDEDVVENEVSEDADQDVEVGANDYDYLLGMPIWSLTQERIDRIKKQIGDKELEIDELIKLTPKEIWNKDLDDFLEEWNTQLSEEQQRKKKLRNSGRRASAKLGIGAGKAKKKRRGSDGDSDFEVGKKKSSALTAIQNRVKGKGGLASFFYNTEPSKAVQDEPPATKPATSLGSLAAITMQKSKTLPAGEDDDFVDIDAIDTEPGAEKEAELDVVAVKKKSRPAGTRNKPKPVPSKPALGESDSESDVFAAVAKEASKKPAAPARAARAKATKKYVVDDDSEESEFDDDKLGDLSTMIKPLGQSTAATGRTLFTAPTRPGSSHGQQKTKSKSKSPIDSDVGIDDTDYAALIPQDSPRRPAARTTNDTVNLSDDDEDDFGIAARKPAAAKAKVPVTKSAPASKPITKKPAAKKSAAAPAPAKKAMPLSPAAKAYAAKQAKTASQPKQAPKKRAVESDEDEEMEDIANDLLSDDDEIDDAPVTRPSRRAAASKPKYNDAESDEEDDSEDDYDDDDGSD
jgi:DNA topoisomerase-2